MNKFLNNKIIYFVVLAAVLLLPFATDALLGRGWVRIVDFAMLYIMLALAACRTWPTEKLKKINGLALI